MKANEREQLIMALEKAIDAGEITEREARAELRAFDYEEIDMERCPHCGYVVSECVCHAWFEEY